MGTVVVLYNHRHCKKKPQEFEIWSPPHSKRDKLIEHLPTAINENRKLPHHPKRQALKTCNCMDGINIKKNNLVFKAAFLKNSSDPMRLYSVFCSASSIVSDLFSFNILSHCCNIVMNKNKNCIIYYQSIKATRWILRYTYNWATVIHCVSINWLHTSHC